MRFSRVAATATLALLLAASVAVSFRSARLAALETHLARTMNWRGAARTALSLRYVRPPLEAAGIPVRPDELSARPSLFEGGGIRLHALGGTLECVLPAAALERALADPAATLDLLSASLPPGTGAASAAGLRLRLPLLPDAPARGELVPGESLSLVCGAGEAVRLRMDREGATVDFREVDLAPFLVSRIPCGEIARAVSTGRIAVTRTAEGASCAGEGRATLVFRGSAASGGRRPGEAVPTVEASVDFRLAGPRLELHPARGGAMSLAGTADLARGTLSLTVDAERFDLGMIGRIFPGAGSIFSDYTLQGFGGLHMAIAGTEPVGILSFENGVLAGDPGRANLVNLGGECAFDADAIVLRELRADYDRTPLSLHGRIGRADGSLNLSVRAEKVPFDKFRSVFAAMGLRIGDTFAGGLFDLDLALGGTVRAPSMEGQGKVSNGTMTFLEDLLEFRRVNGGFALRDGRIGLTEFDGFWGDIPFRGRGQVGGTERDDFRLQVDFANFTPDDIDSWIMASLSRMYFSRESSAGIGIASRGTRLDFHVRFLLKEVDVNLFPVPGSVALDAVSGSLEFHRDESGAVDLERGEFSFGGPSVVKLSLPQVSVFPVTLSGAAEGAVTFDDRATGGVAFTGRYGMPEAVLSVVDSRYDARRISVGGLASSFTRGTDHLAFSVDGSLLDGTFSARGGARDAEGFLLHAQGRFDGLTLERFFAENPRATEFGTGILSAEFRHRALDSESPFRATVSIRDGSLRNLAVANALFGGELENRIYDLPFRSLQAALRSDGRMATIETLQVESDDAATARTLAKLRRAFPLLPEAPRAIPGNAWDDAGRAALSALAQLSDRERPLARLMRLQGFETVPLKPLLHLGELFGEDPGEKKKPARPKDGPDRR